VQIRAQRLADIVRQRQPVTAACLARDRDFAGPPVVDVAQLQPGDFDRAQAQPGHQHEDREVADAGRLVRSKPSSSRCTSASETPTGIPVSCHPAAGGTAHRGPQRRRGQALQVQESQQPPQLRHPALERAHADPLTFPQQEPDHVRRGQVHRELAAIRGRLLAEEPARNVLVPQHGRRGQPRSTTSQVRWAATSRSTGESGIDLNANAPSLSK
jgi:hypothetical protein